MSLLFTVSRLPVDTLKTANANEESETESNWFNNGEEISSCE